MYKFGLLLFIMVFLGGCSGTAPTRVTKATATLVPADSTDTFAFEQNRRLGHAVNLGNALEAPNEGEWGMTLEADFFRVIYQGGFDAVRVPIRWSNHAASQSPYLIEKAFFERIDWVVEQSEKNHLAVILDMHHYQEMMDTPKDHRERFLAIWQQIAQHYQNAPDSVYFELLNEPNGVISMGDTWNSVLSETIELIRQTNPRRTIIVGPANWNSISDLKNLKLPEKDRNLIVTFHYYQPFQFTHQGAEWVNGSDSWLGTTWSATSSQKNFITADLDLANQWGTNNHRPLFFGEFGAYSKADMESRALWTAFIAREAEKRGMSWAYWEFGAGFGAYDRTKKEWIEPIHKALIPD